MVLDSLGKSLRQTLKKVANATHVDATLVKEVVRDIQRALLQSDVNVKMVLNLTKELERRALTEKPPAGMDSRQHVINIIYEEMVGILGEGKELPLKPQKIMLVGLYGQGKTTTCGKLARYFQRKGMNPALIAGDVHRPAAYDQLEQIADEINVPIYGNRKEKKAPKIVREGLKEFEKNHDIIIVDTSGRHALEKDLIKEVEMVAKVVQPDETVLVMDASVGQQAGPQAKAFHDAVGVTSVIITKLDGTAKGGGALSTSEATGAPIVFIGVGEHLDDLERFEPPRFISRLLGMGDIQSLLERAQEAVVDEARMEEVTKKILSGKFTLKEMYEQMEMLAHMGPFRKLMSMIPGLPSQVSDEEIGETQDRLAKFKIMMDSMTDEEMENPKLIKSSRVIRIARGSGTDPKDVKELIKYYNQSKRAIKGFTGNRKMRRQLMKQLKSGNMEI